LDGALDSLQLDLQHESARFTSANSTTPYSAARLTLGAAIVLLGASTAGNLSRSRWQSGGNFRREVLKGQVLPG
jgi:hypothetical protein